ncbi:PadR family transcriptional regulator [Corynebacterium phoceense]|uniref:PadR family transcriptional regulator n=1 Tax=Corynebacterium phoceense TaxID=1686286 RepID=UPI001DB75895|nr:PadR family transcriptional regulator [Corynebacterium phoceense]HJG43178.1 PadR family transcriptional regulator [Corynebacterium phoceense]
MSTGVEHRSPTATQQGRIVPNHFPFPGSEDDPRSHSHGFARRGPHGEHGPGHGHGPGHRRGPGHGPGPGPNAGFGPGFGRGRGFGRGGRAGRGDLRTAILLLLGEEPMHGYQLMNAIGERTNGNWTPSPGAVYPTLSMLEDEELIAIAQESGRKLATITEAGRALLTAHATEWEGFFDAYAQPDDAPFAPGRPGPGPHGPRGGHGARGFLGPRGAPQERRELGNPAIMQALGQLRQALLTDEAPSPEHEQAILEILQRAAREITELDELD